MSSISVNEKFMALVLGCLVLTNLSSPDLVKSPAQNAHAQEEPCLDLSCGENGKNFDSQRAIVQDTKNLDPISENENGILSSDEQFNFGSEESPLKGKVSKDIKVGKDDSVIDKYSSPDTALSHIKSSIETTKTMIESVNLDPSESSITNTRNLPNSNSENEEDIPSLEIIGMRASNDGIVGSEKRTKPEPAKHTTLFPFLYKSLFSMLKSLVRSFLSELVDESNHHDLTTNTTEIINQSSMFSEEEKSSLNATSSSTDSLKRTRFQCAIKNVTDDDVRKVKVVNSTELLDILSLSKSQKSSTCVLVMFYAPWCHFCAQTAPHYNALARAFPQLDILAVDTSHFSYLNARFGTVAVPNIMLFHSRSAVRFNNTHRVLEKFIHFVTNNTGLERRKFVLLEPLDFVGPLPCVVKRSPDWLLWLAWVFVAICTSCGFVQSQYGQGFIARLKVLWQEHQHID